MASNKIKLRSELCESPVKISNQCDICFSQIDNLIAFIDNKPVHEHCLKCNECNHIFSERCFELNGSFFCPEHYIRKKFPQCIGCDEPIFPGDAFYYGSTMGKYHQNCFKCSICQKQLIKGDKYKLQKSGLMVICESHFDSDFKPNFADQSNTISIDSELDQAVPHSYLDFQHNSSNHSFQMSLCDDNCISEDGEQSIIGCSSDDKNSEIRRRTPRTTIKSAQLESLKATFAITPKPTRQMREKLSETTGLSMRVIQVWFQNRRSKERRSRLPHQKRVKCETNDSQTSNRFKNKDKPEISRNLESTQSIESINDYSSKSPFIPMLNLSTLPQPDNKHNNQQFIDNSNWIIDHHQLDSNIKTCQLY